MAAEKMAMSSLLFCQAQCQGFRRPLSVIPEKPRRRFTDEFLCLNKKLFLNSESTLLTFYNNRMLHSPLKSGIKSLKYRHELDDVVDVIPQDRIPVTVICGQLDSGKTTLINHILKASQGKRIAFIENEKGVIAIDDSKLAVKETGTEEILKYNVSYSKRIIRGDLLRLIPDMIEESRWQFDHIIIEANGSADLFLIINTFFSEDRVYDDAMLDSIVTVVDATKEIPMPNSPDDMGNRAAEQIAYADRIILNKIDLIGEEERNSLVQQIKGINCMAPLQQVKFGHVNPDFLFDVKGFQLGWIEKSVLYVKSDNLAMSGNTTSLNPTDARDFTQEQDNKSSSHRRGFSSMVFTCTGLMDMEKACLWLGGLMSRHANDIYRMKGRVFLTDHTRVFVFHSIRELYQSIPGRRWRRNELKVNKIAICGFNMDPRETENGFRECLSIE